MQFCGFLNLHSVVHFFFNFVFAGRCKNGTEAVGCGPQEEFRACADVTITQPDGSADNTINQLGNCKQAWK